MTPPPTTIKRPVRSIAASARKSQMRPIAPIDFVFPPGSCLNPDARAATSCSVMIATGIMSGVHNVFGKMMDVAKTASNDTINFRKVIAAGDFGDLVGADVANNRTDTITVYIVDAAGNRSSYTDAAATGVSTAVRFFVDGKAPVLDGQVVAGDTILPVSNDTITDGQINTGFSNDLNVMTVKLAERLQSLRVIFSSYGCWSSC